MRITKPYRLDMKTPQTSTEADSGDNTIIAAPGSGYRLVITDIQVQNASSTATTVILKNGSTAVWAVLLQNQGDALSVSFDGDRFWELSENTALVINLSGANSHYVNVYHYIERLPND